MPPSAWAATWRAIRQRWFTGEAERAPWRGSRKARSGAGGTAIGIIPRFMVELEWGHKQLTEMRIVEDMRERKHRMLEGADAVVALAGGCGTLEELFETITLKRLGHYLGPIILVNTRGFYDRVVAALEHCIAENDLWMPGTGRCGRS